VTAPTQHCPQCWTERPLEEFISRDGSRFVQWCMPCRDRYKGAGAAWASLTPAERRARMRARPKRRTGDGHHVTFTLRSGNKKTGRIPVSMTDMQSCPTSCSFRDAGCYAEFHNLRAHWARVPERGMSWADFCAAVARLPIGQLWRHNEAGDLPGVGDELDVDAFRELVRANARAGARGFTFTHKPLRRRVERAAVADGNRVGLTVNLCVSLAGDARIALERIRESLRACAHMPARDRLAVYARGRCSSAEGQRLSRMRWVALEPR